MILSCPSCGTRYSQHLEELQAASARCSHCEGTVPIVAARRPYVLIPAYGGGGPAMKIGMDDPQLAEKLTKTALDSQRGGDAGALTYRVASAESASRGMERTHAERFGNANGAAPAIFQKRPAWWQSKRVGRQKTSAVKTPEKGRSRMQEVAVAVVLSLIGGATAYYSAIDQGLDPFTWVLAGGGLGLFMAWVCVRWTRRR
jgi:hypothetical protein